MGTQRITERFAFAGGRVDRSGPRPVIRDVLLCGPTSRNRRRYTAEAFAGDRVKRYDGRPVYLNHGDGRRPRRYEERIAKVINPRVRADGMPVGDLEVRPKHPFAEAFLDDAEHDPGSIGMSHVADCKVTRAADGWDEVTEMVGAESVDVVMDPATTRGLYESTRRSAMPSTLRSVIEGLESRLSPDRRRAARRVLVEMDDMGAVGAAIADAPADEPAADADPDQAIDDAFRSVFHSQVDALLDDSHTLQEFVSKIKDLYKTRAKLLGKEAPVEAPVEAPAEESAKRPAGLAGLISEARAFGLARPEPDDLAVLEGIPTAAGRRAYCERVAVRVREGDAPRSAGKRPGAGELPAAGARPGRTTRATEGVPTAGDKFAAMLRG